MENGLLLEHYKRKAAAEAGFRATAIATLVARQRAVRELTKARPHAVERSLYDGRVWLGDVLQTAPRCFAGYDVDGRFVGSFLRQREACSAIAAEARRAPR